MSRPNRPSTGLSEGSSWQATVRLRNAVSNTWTCGMTTSGMSSLPLAVRVSRVAVERAGLTPIANAACGGVSVGGAPEREPLPS